MTTFYYDPVLDVHHRLPVAAALTTSFYAAPQVPADARRLFDAGSAMLGWDTLPRRSVVGESRCRVVTAAGSRVGTG